MSKRTALYIRASSRDQVQHGFSIPDQLARLRHEAKLAGETIVAEYIDQARSGTSASKRSDYQDLLAAARQREFNRVRFESVDRGHRNDLERRSFEEEMRVLGIDVVYSGEPEKQAPQFRKLQRGIKGVLAEWESDETSQRTYKRQLYRAKKGRWRGGHIPYGLQPDTTGWFKPDPETYPALLWILERRGESLGHHTIAKQLNRGIDLGQGVIVPPTPSVIAYRRRPYLERQDPETGDIIQTPKPMPALTWHKETIEGICQQAVDGVYAGILQWGRRHNRFAEDADGNPKAPVHVDTGRALVPIDLLQKVRAVELMPAPATRRHSARNEFLLSLRCGLCGETMPGYTSTKQKPSGKEYKYRKYRCQGRVKNPGSCEMPILSAEALEQAVLRALFDDVVERDGAHLHEQVNAAIERHREALLEAMRIVEATLPQLTQQRNQALASVMDPSLSPALKAAMAERAEELIREYQQGVARQQQLQAALDTLTANARSVVAVLTDPNLDPARWREPAVFAALRRALTILVEKAVVSEGCTRSSFLVTLSVTTDPIGMRKNGSVVNLGSSRAQGSFFARKWCCLVDSSTSAFPHPDAVEQAALARLYATRLFWAMEDVVYDFLLRRGAARGEDRPDLRSSSAPARARQAEATRRRGARWVDSLCFLPLIGLILILLVGASSLQHIDR